MKQMDIEWFVCPECNNCSDMIKPDDIPTWPSPAAGGKSRKQKSKRLKRTRKRKSINKYANTFKTVRHLPK